MCLYTHSYIQLNIVIYTYVCMYVYIYIYTYPSQARGSAGDSPASRWGSPRDFASAEDVTSCNTMLCYGIV